MRGDDSSLEPLGAGSMSREGNCWDNAVDESFSAVWRRNESRNRYIRPARWSSPPSRLISTRSTARTVIQEAWALSSSKKLTQGSGDGVSTETWELQGYKYDMTVGVESQSAVECKAITGRLRADFGPTKW